MCTAAVAFVWLRHGLWSRLCFASRTVRVDVAFLLRVCVAFCSHSPCGPSRSRVSVAPPGHGSHQLQRQAHELCGHVQRGKRAGRAARCALSQAQRASPKTPSSRSVCPVPPLPSANKLLQMSSPPHRHVSTLSRARYQCSPRSLHCSALLLCRVRHICWAPGRCQRRTVLALRLRRAPGVACAPCSFHSTVPLSCTGAVVASSGSAVRTSRLRQRRVWPLMITTKAHGHKTPIHTSPEAAKRIACRRRHRPLRLRQRRDIPGGHCGIRDCRGVRPRRGLHKRRLHDRRQR